jgi:hypothetical protein
MTPPMFMYTKRGGGYSTSVIGSTLPVLEYENV